MADQPNSAQPPSPEAAAEQRVRAWLSESRWRKARDEAKLLVKQDRARFLPLLIEANVGLTREMIAKGLTTEAQQVLQYLRTIAPAAQCNVLELELDARSGVTAASLPKYAATLASPPAPLTPLEQTRLADLVVLAFEPVAASSPAESALAREVAAVHEALRAVSLSQWDAALATLRAIPHRSAFSHWVVFIRSLIGFYTGDDAKALRGFQSLPAESAPARASQPFLLLMPQPDVSVACQPASEASVESVCQITGLAGLGGLMCRADKLWRTGQFGESYRVFRDNVRLFPTCDAGPLGALSGFFFQAPHEMPVEQRETYLEYFSNLTGFLTGMHRFKNSTEAMRALRMLTLIDAPFLPAEVLQQDWEAYIQHRESLFGPNPRFASLAYGWLGEQLSLVRPQHGFFGETKPRLRDEKGAIQALQRSIELDPDNLSAHLQLSRIYEALKRNSDLNRLLDTMTRRFPDNKQVLLMAAQGCLERKAFTKGLNYLERARQIDQLDPTIPDAIATQQRRLARQHFQQGRRGKGRELLAGLETWFVDDSMDLQRSRWAGHARHGVMECLWGDADRGGELLAQARAGSPHAAVFLLFTHMTHRVYANVPTEKSPFLKECRNAIQATATLARLLPLLRVMEYWLKAPEQPPMDREFNMLARISTSVLRKPFTMEEATDALNLMRIHHVFELAIEDLVERVLREDPKNPKFRLYEIAELGGMDHASLENSRARVKDVLDEARRRHDEPSIREATALLRDLDRPRPKMDFPEDEEFEPDDSFLEPSDEDDLPDIPPFPGDVKALLEMLRNASPAILKEMRETRPPGMSAADFDMLLEIARGNVPIPPLPPPPPPLPPPVKPKSPVKPRVKPTPPPDQNLELPF